MEFWTWSILEENNKYKSPKTTKQDLFVESTEVSQFACNIVKEAANDKK